ncbi:MAG: AsmA family protein, partial [Gammaproteobacteria bacterium]|nr:AsmA family protein [Gammaproteobacteria bacterium]
MTKFLKISGVVFGLIFLLVIATVVYITTRDPNDYKQLISDSFAENTGRSLTIDGDIKISFYPWLGVEVNGVTVGNAQGFGDQPFLETEHAAFRAKFLPLLSGQYIVDTVRLHGVSINLA